MTAKISSLAFVLAVSVLNGQTPSEPYTLPDLLLGIENPKFAEIPDLTDSLRNRGIDFNVSDQELGKIIEAGNKGRRDPREMAGLIREVLNACQSCRAHAYAPMSIDEFRAILKRFSPDAVLQEVKARGVTGLELTPATANVLHEWGAKDDLIAFLVPDDKIPTIPLQAPYQPAPLKRADEYNPGATEGWLKINMELAPGSQSEFIFKHNALFVKPVTGGTPNDIQAFFNKPAPRNKTAEFIDIDCGLENPAMACGQEARDEKRGSWVRSVLPKNSKIKTSLIDYTYLAPDDDGRAGFQIAVANPEKTAQKYSVYLRWKVLDAPKPPPPPPSVGKGGKR